MNDIAEPDAPVMAPTVRFPPPKRSFATRLFGYDIFLSFALGPPPRGTHSYASDLARRLRERDFTVFFSEDEAPVGHHLSKTLRSGLLRSKSLVVIANRAAMERPGWIQIEVEEFKRYHPPRPVIPISIDGALQDPAIADRAQLWLGYQDKIWLDDSAEMLAEGIASDTVVERLISGSTYAKASVKWRWVTRGTFALLALLALGLGVTAKIATDNVKLAQINQSRFLADLSQKTAVTDPAAAVLLGLEALPDSEGTFSQRLRPYLPSAERALYSALLQLRERVILSGHESYVTGVRLSADNRIAFTASSDKTVRMWDSVTGKELVQLPSPGEKRLDAGNIDIDINHTETLIATASLDKTIGIWDASQKKLLERIDVGVQPRSVAFSPDSSQIVARYDDQHVRVWNITVRNFPKLHSDTKLLVGVDEVPTGTARFSPNGKLFITTDWYKVQIWDALTGREQRPSYDVGSSQVLDARIGPEGEGQRLAAIFDTKLRLWDVATHGLIRDIPHDDGDVASLTMSADGRLIATGTDKGTIRLFDAKDGSLKFLLGSHSDRVGGLAFSRDGKRIASASHDGTARMWGIGDAPARNAFLGHGEWINDVAYSADDRYLVTGATDNTAKVWIAETGELKQSLPHPDWVKAVAFSPTGKLIATGAFDGIVRIWQAPDFKTALELPRHSKAVSVIRFSPDEKRLLSASADGTVRLWDLRLIPQFKEVKADRVAGINSVSFNSRGDLFLTAGFDNRVSVWDTDSFRKLRTPIDNNHGEIKSAAFCNSDKWIVAASADGRVVILDASSGLPVAKALRSKVGFESVACGNKAGRNIVYAGSRDGMVRLWDADLGEEIGTVRASDQPVVRVALNRKGNAFVAAANANVLYSYRTFATAQEMVDFAKNIIPRCLTREQRKNFFLDEAVPAWCNARAKWNGMTLRTP